MIYCVSDIHGHYDVFMTLLEKIEFKQSDVLYMLGDAIDRGPDSIKCLQFIMNAPNIRMLIGNHELMMLDTIVRSRDRVGYDTADLWLNYNGGYETCQQYLALPKEEQQAVLSFLKGLPYYLTLRVRSKKYLLVHAGLNLLERKPREHLTTTMKRQRTSHPNEMVWIREPFLRGPSLPEYVIIFGHTPCKNIPGHCQNVIWKTENKIGIDCGCYKGDKLAALRLDDLKEFYVPKYSITDLDDLLNIEL